METQPISWRLILISRQIRRLGHAKKERLEIGSGRLLILKAIIDNPGISQIELGDQIGINKTTMAKAIKKLVEKKLVRKTKDENDRRFHCLYATRTAQVLEEELIEDTKYHSDVLLKGFSDDEKKHLSTFIQRLLDNLDGEIERIDLKKADIKMLFK
jgi:DNA-binding MarR family transcriptional regulator